MDPRDASEQPDPSPDPGDVVHLVLPVGVPWAQLIRAQNAFHELLREVSRSVASTVDDPVTWIVVRVQESSQDHSLAPIATRPTVTARALHTMVEAVPAGMAELSERAERPPYFTDRALELTNQLSASITKEMPFISTRNGSAKADITRQAGTHAKQVLDMPYVSEFGTVEGRLEQIDVHGTMRRFVIYDDLTGQRIECYFGHRISVDMLRAERRVAVTGEIRSRETGEILSVIATELEMIPPDEELPTADDVLGILAR